MLWLSGYQRQCEFSLHMRWIISLVRLRNARFRRESVVFPGRILISFDFPDVRVPAPLCDH